MIYTDHVDLLGRTQLLVDDSKKSGLKLNKLRTCSCLITKLQGKIIKVANKYFENVAKFIYLGVKVPKPAFIKELRVD
jgi:hypothetical protein